MKSTVNSTTRMEAIYSRQSIDKKDSISIETQIELCLREAKNPESVRKYSDKGYSGSNIERPDFQRLLKDIKAGIISKVIIYRLDRMSRSLLDFSKLIEMFKVYGVEFQSTQEKFDTSTPIGNAMLSITMVFAQLERETIQQRIKDNYYARGRQGAYLGGPPPWGFEIVKVTLLDGSHIKCLNPIPEQIEFIQNMFHLYALEGKTLGEIAKDFNKRGILSPKGTIWDTSKISRTLRNPVYVISDVFVYQYYKTRGCIMCNDVSEYGSGVGLYLYGKRETRERKYTDVTNHSVSLAMHVGVIPSNLFLKVQNKLDKNTQLKNTNRGKHSWLTGLSKCKECGFSLTARTSYHSRYRYWYCSGKSVGACGGNNYLQINAVEKIVQNKLFELIRENQDIIVTKEDSNAKKKNDLLSQIEKLNQQAERIIETLLESTEITSKYLNEKLEQIDSQKQALNAQLNDLILESDNNISRKQLLDVINDWDILDNVQRRSIVELFIEKVVIGNSDVEIIWKCRF